MTPKQLDQFQGWFTSHVRSFREADPDHQRNLDLKEAHTARVQAAMGQITSELGLSSAQRRIAATIALFHDLGRFPQYRRYRTFRDPDSDNHARLSLLELDRHRLLDPLAHRERLLIRRAIIFHNRLRLPSRLDPESLLHCQLIRDADKVDILRVMAEEYRQAPQRQNPVVTLGLPATAGVRVEIYHRLLAGELLHYQDLANIDELKVLQLSWVFDISFRPTLRLLNERGDFQRLAASLPDTALRRQAAAFVEEVIQRRLATPDTGCRG